MKIVLTRPAGRGEDFRRRLEAQGHEVVYLPLTEIRDAGPFPDPAPYDGVLFTSVSAVERIPEATQWPRVGAVGPTTAQALRERGVDAAVVGVGGGGELAEAWGECRGQRLLLPQAAEAHPALEQALRSAGAEVDAVAVYETRPLEQVDVEPFRRADVICFFAPSAVRAFRALAPETHARYWALGATTEAVVRDAGLPLTDHVL